MAWTQIYREFGPFILSSARRLGTPAADVLDVVHDVFIVLMRKIGDFEDGNLHGWLYRITANTVSSQRRRKAVRETCKAFLSLFMPQTGRPLDLVLDDRQRLAQTQKLLAKLSQKKRQVLVLHEIHGLNGDEIAEYLDCPIDTVWSRLRHARTEFKALVDKQPELRRELQHD